MWLFSKTTIALVIVSVLLAGTTWIQRERQRAISAEAARLKTLTEQLSAKLNTVTEKANAADRAQADLRADIQRTESLLSTRTTLIERLKRENAELRAWADAALPVDIVRVRERPELAGAAAYREWLSARDSVPLDGDPAENQQPAAQ